MLSISLITPTRDRPEAFSRCEAWVRRQTRQPDEWIVVDDGDQPASLRMGQTHVRRRPSKEVRTLGANIVAGVEAASCEAIVILEDDDWYAPTYLEEMGKKLEEFPLVGTSRIRYYALGNNGGWRLIDNAEGCSVLAHTGLRREFAPGLTAAAAEVYREKRYDVDGTFWRAHRKVPRHMFHDDAVLWVGIKGGPGRFGLGCGHRGGWRYSNDNAVEILRGWIGDDVDVILGNVDPWDTENWWRDHWGDE